MGKHRLVGLHLPQEDREILVGRKTLVFLRSLTIPLRPNRLRASLRECQNSLASTFGFAHDSRCLCLTLLKRILRKPFPRLDHGLENFLGGCFREHDLVDADVLNLDAVAGLLHGLHQHPLGLIFDFGQLEALTAEVDQFVESVPADEASNLLQTTRELPGGFILVFEFDIEVEWVCDSPCQIGLHDHTLPVGCLQFLDRVLEKLEPLRVVGDLVDRPGELEFQAWGVLNTGIIRPVEGGSHGHLVVPDLIQKHVGKQGRHDQPADQESEGVFHRRLFRNQGGMFGDCGRGRMAIPPATYRVPPSDR